MVPAANQERAPSNARHSPWAPNNIGNHGRCNSNPCTQGFSRVVQESYLRDPQEPRMFRTLKGVPGPDLKSGIPGNAIALPAVSGRKSLQNLSWDLLTINYVSNYNIPLANVRDKNYNY